MDDALSGIWHSPSQCSTEAWNNEGVSNPSVFGRRRVAFPSIPRGEVLATYETYDDAQKAVDALAKANFPVKELSIIGNDLKSVERVTGKLNYGRASVAGAASGAWLGLFFGLLMLIFSPTPDYGLVAAALLIGAGFGMLFGIISYLMNRRRRDFTSVMQVIAANYQIIVSAESASTARNALEHIGMRHSPARASAAVHPTAGTGGTAPAGDGDEAPGAEGSPDEPGPTKQDPAHSPSDPLPPPQYGERI